MKTKILALSVCVFVAVLTALAAPAACDANSWVQASFVLGDGFNIGTGFRPLDWFNLSLNLVILEVCVSATASALLYIPHRVFVLTGAYVGAGATWEIHSKEVHPSVLAGGEFHKLFAEFEWVMAPASYGKVRSGVRITF